MLHVSRRACILNMAGESELKQEKWSFFNTPEEREQEEAENGGQSSCRQARSAVFEPGRLDSHQVGTSQHALGKWSNSIAGGCCFLLPVDVRCGKKCCFAENRCQV